jgi:hypothetical protein
MPVSGTLRVPDQHRAALIQLTNLDQAVLTDLLQAIESSESSLERMQEAVTSAVPGADEALFSALLSLAAFRTSHGISAETTAAALRETLGNEAGSGNIVPVLAAPRLVRIAKAYDLSEAYERKLHSFRILTELRPVWDEEKIATPEEFVITHQLELTFLRNDQVETLLVAVDGSELPGLLYQVQRAQEKDSSLQEHVRTTRGVVVNTGDDGPWS